MSAYDIPGTEDALDVYYGAGQDPAPNTPVTPLIREQQAAATIHADLLDAYQDEARWS